MSILNDEMIKQVNDDLYRWGQWVESFRPVQGHGTMWAGKDETRHHYKMTPRQIDVYECSYQFADGQCIAAQPNTRIRNIPAQIMTAPKQHQAKQAGEEHDDAVALEIDGYLCQLAQQSKQARRLANYIYRWHQPREVILEEMKISKDRYYRMAEYIPVFVMGRRLAAMSESVSA